MVRYTKLPTKLNNRFNIGFYGSSYNQLLALLSTMSCRLVFDYFLGLAASFSLTLEKTSAKITGAIVYLRT